MPSIILGKGRQVVAMSGKFHTSWGEFGGFKHPDALRGRGGRHDRVGRGCSFGDQAHPSGLMDLATYRNIGAAYGYVKKIEDYGLDGLCRARTSACCCSSARSAYDQGVAAMLLESQTDFEVVDPALGFGRYEAIVLPGLAGASTAGRRGSFRGVPGSGAAGDLLVLGREGALDPAKWRFPARRRRPVYLGPAAHELDYTVVKPPIAAGLVTTPFLNYKSGMLAKLTTGSAARHDSRALF